MKPTISYCRECQAAHPPGEHTKGRRRPSAGTAPADAPFPPRPPKPTTAAKRAAAPVGRTVAAVSTGSRARVVTEDPVALLAHKRALKAASQARWRAKQKVEV